MTRRRKDRSQFQEACGEDKDREAVNNDFVELGGVAGLQFSECLRKLVLDGEVPIGVVLVKGITARVPRVGKPVRLAVRPDGDFQGELCVLEDAAGIIPL